MPRIRDMQRLRGVSPQLGELPETLWGPLEEVLADFCRQELSPGEHVELLLVEGHPVRVNLFVDLDGTLWLERVAVGPPRGGEAP